MQPEDQRKREASYTIIPRVLVFLTHRDEVLLLRGAPDKKLWANQYNGLGGHVEPGETPYAAALREVQEEAGISVSHLELRAVVHITMPEPPGIMLFVFVGETPRVAVQPSAEGVPEWVPRRRLTSLPLVEDLPHLLRHIFTPELLVYGNYSLTDEGLRLTFE
jgi:8-oxo-dGTP diphosphatase